MNVEPATSAPLYQIETRCRTCGRGFDQLIDFGQLVLSDFLLPDQPDPPSVPLEVVVCQHCGLVQLQHSVDRDLLYRQYWYLSSINESMVAELQHVVRAAEDILGGFKISEIAVDVGANDGTLLQELGRSIPCPLKIAFEPAKNLFEVLHGAADVVYNDYFPGPSSKNLLDRSVRLITSIACFYDLDDPRAFVQEVDRLLTKDGLWIVQMQDLAQMVQATAFDNICAEHRAYYSTSTLQKLIDHARVDLRIVGVEQRAINGGSLRYYIRRKDQRDLGTSVDAQVAKESEWTNWYALEEFAWRIGERKRQIVGAIKHLQDSGHPVDMYGASTKGSTLLQVCGLGHHLIRQAVERSPAKWGKVTSGTRIPIISEADWRVDPAPATLLSIWQWTDSTIAREHEYLSRGGIFLAPLPSVKVIYGS